MSAVDAPPGVAFGGQASGEFVSRARPRRLARRVLIAVGAAGALTMVIALRNIHRRAVEVFLVLPLFCISVAALGYAVRRARLRIGAGGIRWGWRTVGFTLSRERLRSVRVYDDAVAFVPARGSTWFLTARDWDRFERVLGALRSTGISFERHRGKSPFAARVQGYGLVLDVLLVVDALAAFAVLALLYLS